MADLEALTLELAGALRQAAAQLDQLLNGQSLPDSEEVDAALTRANAAIREYHDQRGTK